MHIHDRYGSVVEAIEILFYSPGALQGACFCIQIKNPPSEDVFDQSGKVLVLKLWKEISIEFFDESRTYFALPMGVERKIECLEQMQAVSFLHEGIICRNPGISDIYYFP